MNAAYQSMPGRCRRVGLALLVALLPAAALAQPTGYVVDQRGQPIRNNFGGCIKSPTWTPTNAVAECDPDLAPRRATTPAPAPARAAPATRPAPAPARPAPARPAAAPAPARPAAAAAAVRPAPAVERLSLSADALFDYGKASLKPEGERAIDQIAQRVRGANLEKVLAVGHTDRLGSSAGNAKLSLARANAVKARLVRAGVPERLIQTEGRGSKEPKTGAQCKGNKANASLIKCLQPDRRVDLTIAGSRPR